MGLWNKGLNGSKNGVERLEDSENQIIIDDSLTNSNDNTVTLNEVKEVKEVNETPVKEGAPVCEDPAVSTEKVIDWEERHFQICLALLSRAELHSYHSGTVSSVDPKLPKIIKTADRMVELLKEHHNGDVHDIEDN